LDLVLQKYFKAFSRLKRGGTKYGLAPHKPVLLLSIIELFEKGFIMENAVPVNADLVGTFKENWLLLVSTGHQADFTQPFYYLQNERVAGAPFWHLRPYAGCQINSHIASITTLSKVCAYGYFNNELYLLLHDTISRSRLKQCLLETYFPNYTVRFDLEKTKNTGYFHDQMLDVLNEAEPVYRRISIHTEEDVFVRNGLFKKFVPKLYNNQCSFSGMKINSTFNYNFIDACHIVPFSNSHNDKIVNGIALCPNMHRAFDRGLLSIDSDYRILVSGHVHEDENHPYGFRQLAGKEVLLPEKSIHYPDQLALAWHREHILKR
jgi:putative restriction endonuclease